MDDEHRVTRRAGMQNGLAARVDVPFRGLGELCMRLGGERREDVDLLQALGDLVLRDLLGLRRGVGRVGTDGRGEGDLVSVQRVPDCFSHVGVDALAERVVAGEVLDLVDDGGVAERTDAGDGRALAGDSFDVCRGRREDADHRSGRHVVVHADLQHASIEVVVREDLQPLAGDD